MTLKKNSVGQPIETASSWTCGLATDNKWETSFITGVGGVLVPAVLVADVLQDEESDVATTRTWNNQDQNQPGPGTTFTCVVQPLKDKKPPDPLLLEC